MYQCLNKGNIFIIYGIRRLGSPAVEKSYIYVGISKVRNGWTFKRTAEKRLFKHIGEAKRGTHYNKGFERVINNSSILAVDVLEVLIDFTLKQARKEESFIITEVENKNANLLNLIKDNNGFVNNDKNCGCLKTGFRAGQRQKNDRKRRSKKSCA